MEKSLQELRRDIGVQLAVVARKMRNDFDRHVGQIGLTRSQWTMIAVVARRPGATQRQIADVLEMSEASAGRLVDKLVNEGLLARTDRADDRRARAVNLTEAANPLLEQMHEFARSREDRFFKGISAEELAQLRELLGKLHANINPGHPILD